MHSVAEYYAIWGKGLSKFLVTGCARSGTVYMSHAFTEAGIWTGHEKAINIDDYCTHWETGEVAWQAAAYLPGLRQQNPAMPIFHQVRHPLLCVRSCVNYSIFSVHHAYANFAFRVMGKSPEARLSMSELEQACYYWLRWNQLVEPYADYRYRIEDIDEERFKALLILSGNGNGNAAAINDLPRNMNAPTSKAKLENLTWDDIPGWIRFNMQEQALRYGYKE